VCLMQYMLDICESFADDCDMKFNCTKSFALRIGPRFLCNCAAYPLWRTSDLCDICEISGCLFNCSKVI